MSLLTEALAAVALALLIALGGVGFLYHRELGKTAMQQADLQVLQKALITYSAQRVLDSNTIASLQADKALQARKSAGARQATETALQAAKPWSEATVPAGVLAALSDDSGGPNVPAK